MRRCVLAILGALLLVVALAAPAGAQTTIDGWWLTSYGSAHCVLTNNHLVCERYDANGYWTGYVVDAWLPAWCQIIGIYSGDAAGAPMRIRLAAPYGWGAGCYPGYENSRYYGWHTGTGHHEGQYLTAGYTRRAVIYVGGDPNTTNAYGTRIEVA